MQARIQAKLCDCQTGVHAVWTSFWGTAQQASKKTQEEHGGLIMCLCLYSALHMGP